MSLTRNVRDVPTAIILQFISTFGVWILADRIGLSGVLTMVCYAVFVAGRRRSGRRHGFACHRTRCGKPSSSCSTCSRSSSSAFRSVRF